MANDIKLDVRKLRRLWWEGKDKAKANDDAFHSVNSASVTSLVEDKYTDIYNAITDRQLFLSAQDSAKLLKEGHSITIEQSPR